jgi:hypothetical protein
MDKHPYSHPQDKLLMKGISLSGLPDVVVAPEPIPVVPDIKAEPSGRKKERSNGKR